MLRELTKLLATIEHGWAKSEKYPLYRRARADLVRACLRADLELRYQNADNEGACGGPLEDESCLEEIPYGGDLRKTLTEHLGRQPRAISKSSTGKTNLVKFIASNR